MKYLFSVLLFFFFGLVLAQTKDQLIEQAQDYQLKLNAEYSNSETSILSRKDFKNFKGLELYPIDAKYIVQAKFIRTPDEKPFKMATTTDRLATEVKYGEAHFEIDGKKLKLELYQSVPPMTDPEYVDYLFLPFTDDTNGDGSYGGGRFIDARIPTGDIIVIDFNKAYNPYCAYNSKYSCPIPPRANRLAIRIEAGVKDFRQR